MTTVLIVSLAVVVVAGVLWWAIARMRRVVGQGREAVAGLDRQATATSRGFTSGGGRGTATIGVDATRFVVALWSPPSLTEIPVKRIVAVEAARTRDGRSGRDALRVRFRGQDGTEDAVDLVVADVPGWVKELRRRARIR